MKNEQSEDHDILELCFSEPGEADAVVTPGVSLLPYLEDRRFEFEVEFSTVYFSSYCFHLFSGAPHCRNRCKG